MSRYAFLAPVYDLVSLEWPIYRPGRVAAVEALDLRAGQTVLVVGCGTGLSLPLLSRQVGGRGRLVGIDASPAMLSFAARRACPGTPHVLTHADATSLSSHDLPETLDGVDAALFCYSLSLMRPWLAAWRSVTALLSPGASVAVADLALPSRGGPPARLAARALSAAGGSDIEAHPWSALESECVDVRCLQLWGGHVQVRAGRWPGQE